MYFDNGDKYEGKWKNDKRCGDGEYTWLDGTYYQGTFKNGLLHGEGVLFSH